MAFFICNGLGESADSPTAEVMRKFLDELDPDDKEHGAVWVADDDDNALSMTLVETLPSRDRTKLGIYLECLQRESSSFGRNWPPASLTNSSANLGSPARSRHCLLKHAMRTTGRSPIGSEPKIAPSTIASVPSHHRSLVEPPDAPAAVFLSASSADGITRECTRASVSLRPRGLNITMCHSTRLKS